MCGIEFDLLLGDVRSLKQKRGIVRPITSELRRKFSVTAAETGDGDLLRRALIGAAVVSGDAAHAQSVIDTVERYVAELPEVQLLSARRRLFHIDDEP